VKASSGNLIDDVSVKSVLLDDIVFLVPLFLLNKSLAPLSLSLSLFMFRFMLIWFFLKDSLNILLRLTILLLALLTPPMQSPPPKTVLFIISSVQSNSLLNFWISSLLLDLRLMITAGIVAVNDCRWVWA